MYELKGGKAFHASFIGRKALKDLGGPLSPVANGGQFPPNLRLILSVPCPNGPASFPQIKRPGRWRLSNRQQRLQRVHRRQTSFAEEDTKLLEPTQDFSLSDYSRPRSHLPSPVFHPPSLEPRQTGQNELRGTHTPLLPTSRTQHQHSARWKLRRTPQRVDALCPGPVSSETTKK